MSRHTGFDHSDLERALRDLGPRLALPDAPGLAARVTTAISAPATAPPRGAARWPRRAVAFGTAVFAVAVASAALAFSPTARDAVADFLGIGGVRIEVGSPGPTPTTAPGENLSLGVETTLEDARARVDFPVPVPAVPGLPETPDRVYYSDFPQGGRVSFVYAPRRGLPETSSTGVGLLLTQFRAEIGQAAVKKLGVDQQVRPTEVDGHPAYWVRGPHTLFFLDAEGRERSETLRLSANALIWVTSETTLRIESELGLEESRAIAESMT